METIDDRTSRALDSALEMTFPASDPIAVYVGTDRDRPPAADAGWSVPGSSP